MHAVLVTFHSTMSLENLEKALTAPVRAMDVIPGLVRTTWMQAGARIGSFQVFADRLAAERYLGGDVFQQWKQNTAFSDFEIRHFDVIQEWIPHGETLSREPASSCPAEPAQPSV